VPKSCTTKCAQATATNSAQATTNESTALRARDYSISSPSKHVAYQRLLHEAISRHELKTFMSSRSLQQTGSE
jgi:hypothetical protein